MPDIMPQADDELADFLDAFAAFCVLRGALLGLSVQQIADIQNLANTFRAALTAIRNLEDSLRVAVAGKNVTRDTVKALVRLLKRLMETSINWTDLLRTEAGFPPLDQPPPTSVGPGLIPDAVIESAALKQTIYYFPRGQQRGAAMPPEARWIQFFLHVAAADAAAPTLPSQFAYVDKDPSSPFPHRFSEADGGKTAYWLMRYIGRDEGEGNWSEIISATIPAV